MQSEKIIIVGGFPEIIELCENSGYNILGIIDAAPITAAYTMLGRDDIAKNIYQQYPDAKIVISPDLPHVRKKLVNYYREIGFRFASVISPKANISKSCVIGEGSIIQDFVNISSNVRIGAFVKLNTMSNIMHDSNIGDFVTIAPNAVILGCVSISGDSYIGANATILPGLSVATGITIGAGAVLTKNAEESGVVYAGIPAKELK